MEKLEFDKFKAAFDRREVSKNIDLIRQLLYDFSYKNLSAEDSNYKKEDVSSIRIGIFNFLYSGSFEDQINEPTKFYFKEIVKSHLIDKLKEAQESDKKDKEKTISEINEKLKILPTWDDFYRGFEKNWNALILHHKNNYLNNIKDTIRHIVVYEAPPLCQDNEDIKDKYFLMSNNGSYATTIKNTFNAPIDAQVCNFMAVKNIGYFDLIMAPMPLSSDLRKKWSTQPSWQIGGKQLPVILFELGIAHLILEGKKIENPTFAIGAPALTSTSIFEHYSDKLLKVWKKTDVEQLEFSDIVFGEPDKNANCNYEIVFSSNLSLTNSQTTHKIRCEEGRGIIFPLFKSNVISGSNYLSELLMKNAFDLY